MHFTIQKIRSFAPYFFLVLLIFIVWYFDIFILKRPYWIATTDVEMDFLFRSLAISSGHFFKHGFGLFVDFLGGVIAFVMGAQVSNFQPFLKVVYSFGLIASIAGILLVQRKFSEKLSLSFFLIAVVVFLINPSVRLYMGYWSAEMFVPFFGILAVLFLINSLESISWRKLFWSGFFGGFAMSIKPYFIPFIFASCVGYFWVWRAQSVGAKSVKNFIKFVFPYLLGFFVAVVIGFMPFINGVRATAWAMFYGVREQSLIDIMRINAEVFIKSDLPWFLLTLVVLFALVFTLINMKKQKKDIDDEVLIIFVIALSILLTLLLTFVKGGGGALSQSPGGALRFLLPIAIYELFAIVFLSRIYARFIKRSGIVVLIASLSLFLVWEMTNDLNWMVNAKTVDSNIRNAIDLNESDFLNRKGYAPRVLFRDVNVPVVALYGGDRYVQGFFSRDIAKIFPNERYKNLTYPLESSDINGADIFVYTNETFKEKDKKSFLEADFFVTESERLTFIIRK
jgi:hypothetical protein